MVDALAQQEIFGRFVLLEQLDATGPETCRALDLERELAPVVTVRRLPRWGSFPRRERDAFFAALELRKKGHGDLLAAHVDGGEIEGVPYWATAWAPGVSLDRVLERAIEHGRLSRAFALTVGYCAAAALLDLESEHIDRCDNMLVAPLVHPRRVVVGWNGRPLFLGVSFEQTQPDDEERRYTPRVVDAHAKSIQGRARAAADAFGVAGLVYELCTGAELQLSACTPEAVDDLLRVGGPLGKLPSELHQLLRTALLMKHDSARELLHGLEPLMKAAGGGLFSDVGAELDALFTHEHVEESQMIDRSAALAKKLRRHFRKDATTEAATVKLRLRPASQEGPPPTAARPPTPPDPRMVHVSGGRFLFGTPFDPPCYVDVAGFFIDRHPVTIGEFLHYLEATRAPMPAAWAGTPPSGHSDHPVTGVSPDEADAYARFAGKRLPTEVEWELAARGFDGRPWPWGSFFDAARLPTTWRRPFRERELEAIGTHSPHGDSPFGVADLGMAWEWTAALNVDGGRVVRGGPWRNRAEPPQLSNRSYENAGARDVTFRCVRDVDTGNRALDEITRDD